MTKWSQPQSHLTWTYLNDFNIKPTDLVNMGVLHQSAVNHTANSNVQAHIPRLVWVSTIVQCLGLHRMLT